MLKHPLVLALLLALGTVLVGWGAVPVIAFGWGLLRSRERVMLPATGGAILGWGFLLGLEALQGPVFPLADRVGGVLGIPGWGLIAATLTWAALLTVPAAWLGRSLVRRQV